MSNPFQITFNPAMQGVGATGGNQQVNRTSFTGGGTSSGSSNLFSKNTAGINEAMNDQPVFTTAQAGIKSGVAGKKFNAIG